MKQLQLMIPKKEEQHRVIVRLSTSYWHDTKGIYLRKSLKRLERKCIGFDFFIYEADMCNAQDTLERVINLWECEDGIYEIIVVNESRDFESGTLDDWDFKLIKYEEAEVIERATNNLLEKVVEFEKRSKEKPIIWRETSSL